MTDNANPGVEDLDTTSTDTENLDTDTDAEDTDSTFDPLEINDDIDWETTRRRILGVEEEETDEKDEKPEAKKDEKPEAKKDEKDEKPEAKKTAKTVDPKVEKDEGEDKEASAEKEEDQKKNKKEESSTPDKFKIKVNGEEKEVSLQELQRAYGKESKTNSELQELNQQKKQIEDFYHALKHNPMALLSNPKLGIDLRKISEDYLSEQIRQQQLTPEQRELESSKAQLRQYEAQRKAQEQQQQTEKIKKAQQAAYVQISQDIDGAVKESGLPASDMVKKRYGYYLQQAAQRKMNLNAADVSDLVREDFTNDLKSLLGGLTSEQLIDLLGAENMDKLRQARVQQHEQKKTDTKNGGTKSTTKRKQKKSWTTSELRELRENGGLD